MRSRGVVFFLLLIVTINFCIAQNLLELEKRFDKGEDFIEVIIELKKDDNAFGIRNFEVSDFILSDLKQKEKTVHFSSGGFATKISKSEFEKLKNSNKISYIEPVRYFEIKLQESVEIINATSTWETKINNQNLTGNHQTICIIDTGINFSHPDLQGKNMTKCLLDCIDKVCVENCSETDLNGHGTHVAGITSASGNINGIATGSSLIGLKVFPGADRGGATTTGIKNAIDWCVENSETYNISIISMSLGTVTAFTSNCDSEQPSFNTSITNAYNKNISVVVSTGNEGNTSGIGSPACISKAIPVADTYDSNIGNNIEWIGVCTDATTFLDKIVCHANRNPLVKLLAPGAVINSTDNDGIGYIEYSGTSMATPMVAGAIAILNQYLFIQNKTKTPHELEDVLNDTGKVIYDSETGLNFSRIDVYSAVFSLDETSPNCTLVSPNNETTIDIGANQSFVCNATDDLSLSNITFYLWNSSLDLVNETSINVSSKNTSVTFNVSNFSSGVYYWNCKAIDENGNSNFANENYTLEVLNVKTELLFPDNNSYVNNVTNFSCFSKTAPNFNLSNVTFYLWNSSNVLVYNYTKDISGITNTTIFNYTFENESDYFWNCKSRNNESYFDFANENYTVTYDITSPIISLISPASSVSYTSNSQIVSFSYSLVESNEIANCSLVVNDVIKLTNSSINQSLNQAFSSSFTPATYNWQINCTDSAGNVNSSESRSFTVSAPVIVNNGGGGGGGGTTYKTYNVNSEELKVGKSYELKNKEKIKFITSKSEEHILTVNKIESNFVNLTIESEPINLLLFKGQERKLNISSPDYYDLFVSLNSIQGTKANITIKEIYEIIPKIEEILENGSLDIVNETEKLNESEKDIPKFYDFFKNRLNLYKIGIVSLVIIFIIIIIFIVIKLKKPKNETIEPIHKRK